MNIDVNIPPPKPRNMGITQMISERVPGDSWLVDSPTIYSWLAIAKQQGKKITVRMDRENPGKHRVWMLK